MENLWRDVRQAARALARRPGPSAVCVLVLAAGIGGATAIFSVADAVVLRPLPYRDPERLVLLHQSDLRRDQPVVELGYTAFLAWRDQARTFESVTGVPSTNGGPFVLTGHGDPLLLLGQRVSANFFDTLGVRPALGRGFVPEDDEPDAQRVLVLSDALWRGRFDADPAILGRTLTFDAQPSYTVVGVMPPDFAYPQGVALWAPLGPDAQWAIEKPGVWWMMAIGRLRPGIAPETARAELDGIWRRLYGAQIDTAPYAVVMRPLGPTILGGAQPALLALLGGVGLLLAIACANVAGLLVVHAIERRGEWAVRITLGASRLLLARQVMIESLLVAAIGGAAGVLLAFWATPILVALVPKDVPRLEDVAVNGRALGFGLLTALATALLSGLAPAWSLRRSQANDAFRTGARSVAGGAGRARALLVVSEVALALSLVVGAGLLVRTFLNLRAVPLGFEADRVLAMDVDAPGARYPKDADWRSFYARLLERVSVLPGVEAAATVTKRPLWGVIGMDWPFEVEGQSKEDADRNPPANLEAVSPDYFRTMGIALRGRAFTADDRDGSAGVAIVSEGTARRYWPGQDAIGQRLRLPLPETPYDMTWLTVVGVAADARYRELKASRLDIYLSSAQANHRPNHVVVRTRVPAGTLLPSIRDAVRALDPGVPVTDVITLSDAVAGALGHPRLTAGVFGAFAALALLLAGIGLYGLLASSVTRRTREIGVRVALGAGRGDVRWLVLREALGLTAIGAALGLGLSWALGRLLESLLFGVAAVDAVTAAAALLLLGALTAAAVLLPARRAARVEPAVALRAE